MQRSEIYESMPCSIEVEKVCGCFFLYKDLHWWWHSENDLHFKVPSFKTTRESSHTCTRVKKLEKYKTCSINPEKVKLSQTFSRTHSYTHSKRGLGFQIVRQIVALIISLSQEKHVVGVKFISSFLEDNCSQASHSFIHSLPSITAKIWLHLSHTQSGIPGSLLARDSLSDPNSCVVVKQGLHFFQTSLWLPPV